MRVTPETWLVIYECVKVDEPSAIRVFHTTFPTKEDAEIYADVVGLKVIELVPVVYTERPYLLH